MRAIALALIALIACGGDDDAAVDPLFDLDHVLAVDIEMDPDDWDALRGQTRSVLDILYGDCLAQPFESPFTYFEGDVTIDGQRFDRVGVRKKGFLGSLSEEKPSLKLKLDEYVAGVELEGLDKLTFNNSQQDPSYVRQCLSYQVFRDAGVPAPRCNFAQVTVNGDDLGLFVHVESLDAEFVERHFEDSSGKLYEGTLSDFRPEYVNTFELKNNGVADDRADLDAMVDALTVPDSELEGALDPLVDLDAFYTFWAAEVLTSHWDGYASNTNNFYLYADPTSGRFHFIPWGTDGTFGPNALLEDPGAPPDSVFATGLLARRLYLHGPSQSAYVARLRELLDGAWDEDQLLDQIDRMEETIEPFVSDGDLGDEIDAVREVVMSQREVIEAELDGGPPEWTTELRDAFCLEPIGQLDVTFDTTWGTLAAPDPFAAGDGTWDATADGAPLTATMVGAMAGLDPDESAGPRALVQVFALLDDDHIAVLFVQLQPSVFAPGTHEIDWNGTFGGVIHYEPATDTGTLVGVLGIGAVTFDEAESTDGAVVRGSVSAEIVELPF